MTDPGAAANWLRRRADPKSRADAAGLGPDRT
jgi:hypothetical protein